MSYLRNKDFRPATFRPFSPEANFRPYAVIINVSDSLGIAEAITFVLTTKTVEDLSIAESITFNVDWTATISEAIAISEATIFTVITNVVVNSCDPPDWNPRDIEVT